MGLFVYVLDIFICDYHRKWQPLLSIYSEKMIYVKYTLSQQPQEFL